MRSFTCCLLLGLAVCCGAAEPAVQLPKPQFKLDPSDPAWLGPAVQLHGHLGPWLVAGLRIGAVGASCRGRRRLFRRRCHRGRTIGPASAGMFPRRSSGCYRRNPRKAQSQVGGGPATRRTGEQCSHREDGCGPPQQRDDGVDCFGQRDCLESGESDSRQNHSRRRAWGEGSERLGRYREANRQGAGERDFDHFQRITADRVNWRGGVVGSVPSIGSVDVP